MMPGDDDRRAAVHGRHRRLGRPPPRAIDALLHRDVGALQLLRDARLPDPLPGRARGGWRPRVRPGRRRVDLWDVYRQRVGRGDPRRPRRRSAARPVQRRPRRRQHHRARTLHPGVQGAAGVLHGPGPRRARHGPPEAKCQHAGRVALRAGRSSARRRVLDLLHGDQQRRAVRADRGRLSRAARGLARRLRLRRVRHGVRPRAVLGGTRPLEARPGPSRAGSSDPHSRRSPRTPGSPSDSAARNGRGSSRSSSSSCSRLSSGAPTSRPDRR